MPWAGIADAPAVLGFSRGSLRFFWFLYPSLFGSHGLLTEHLFTESNNFHLAVLRDDEQSLRCYKTANTPAGSTFFLVLVFVIPICCVLFDSSTKFEPHPDDRNDFCAI